jgi:signal transduction histidine kinase
LLTAGWARWDDAAKIDMLRDIEISTRMLGELLGTILDFSLLSSDTVELRLAPVDVQTAVDGAVSDITGHFKSGLPVALHVDVPDGLTVTADPTRFRQVIRSLLDNAVKFTPPGGRVGLVASRDAAADRCRVEVTDNGAGISPEALRLIFDRFYQEDNSRTRKYGGMGLGLALVRRLCDAHGATVRATSELGSGSRFTVLWPLGEQAHAARPAGFQLFTASASGGLPKV